MLRHLGYVATALSIDATTNHTCRLRNATPERLRGLIRRNLQDFGKILEFNLQNGIYLYRISSKVIPFASHPVNRIPWWDEFADLFDQIGGFIAQHRFRVSMHPGQFTVLSSPNPEVVAAAVRELQWHVRFLECLSADMGNKVVVHGGGIYGDKAKAAERFIRVANSLPQSWKQRLVVENDERNFTVQDVLEISNNTGLPVVFDWLHYRVNPGDENDVPRLMGRCFETWESEDGAPKVHFSSQARDGRPGQHADWIDSDEFEEFLQLAPARDFDCMLEAKAKDLALFRLRDDLRRRSVAWQAA